MQPAKSNWKVLGVMAAALALAGAGYAQAPSGQKPESAGQAGPSTAAHAAKAEAPQQMMAARAGEYTRVIQFVNAAGPQGPPSLGSSKISVILDGHFLLEENSDVVFGKPVHGMRIYGYNNLTGQYEAAWMYTLSNAILMLTGSSNDGGKTVDYSGESATADGEKLTLRAHFRQVDADQFVITIANVGESGKEIPFQQTTYTRKK